MSPRIEDPGSVHRQKIFGWLSLENILQTAVILSAVFAFFIKLNDKVDSLATTGAAESVRLDVVSKDVALHATELQHQQDLTSEHAAKIEALFRGRDEDHQLLGELNKNVGILLDRTNPKKQ